MEIAQEYYHVKEMYAVGSMVTLAPHTVSRDFWATFSLPQIKKTLSRYQLSREMNFETPPGGRPTLNSYLLWMAKTHNLAAANLWVPVPFYLVGNDDPESHRKVLEFLDKRMDLSLNFDGIDASVKQQNDKLGRLRKSSPDIDGFIRKLENNIQLSEEEHESLSKAVDDCLRKRNY